MAAVAALVIWCAWSTYRMRPAAWWVSLATVVVTMASGIVTFAGHDMLEMYRLMGYPTDEVVKMQQSGIFTGQWMLVATAASGALSVGYLLWVRRFFSPAPRTLSGPAN